MGIVAKEVQIVYQALYTGGSSSIDQSPRLHCIPQMLTSKENAAKHTLVVLALSTEQDSHRNSQLLQVIHVSIIVILCLVSFVL